MEERKGSEGRQKKNEEKAGRVCSEWKTKRSKFFDVREIKIEKVKGKRGGEKDI